MANARCAVQEALCLFRAGANRLEYLSENDWVLLMDKAVPRTFQQDETIVEYGKRNANIFIIVQGKATVISSRGFEIASVGPGEILGEMAFLEGSHASAHVKANTLVQTFALAWDTLQRVFDLYPHLGSRFYRSIAVSLSRRLRNQISD